MEKTHGVRKSCGHLSKSVFVLFNAMAESVNCSLFLKNLGKRFCKTTYKLKKKLSNTSKIYCNSYRKNLSAIIHRLSISL